MAIGIYRGSDGLARLRDDFRGFFDTLPKYLSEDLRAVTTIYSKEFENQIIRKELIWTGELLRSVSRIRKVSDNHYVIEVPHYGPKVARMHRHYVSLKPEHMTPQKEPLKRWMEDKGIDKPGITVKPHNWIKDARPIARARIEQYVRKHSRIKRNLKKHFKGGGFRG